MTVTIPGAILFFYYGMYSAGVFLFPGGHLDASFRSACIHPGRSFAS